MQLSITKSMEKIPEVLYHGTTTKAHEMAINHTGRYYNICSGEKGSIYCDDSFVTPMSSAASLSRTFKSSPLLLIIFTSKIDTKINQINICQYKIEGSIPRESYKTLELRLDENGFVDNKNLKKIEEILKL